MYPDRDEYSPTELVPCFKLRRRWLGKLGPSLGACLKVVTSHDIITLTVVERPVVGSKRCPGSCGGNPRGGCCSAMADRPVLGPWRDGAGGWQGSAALRDEQLKDFPVAASMLRPSDYSGADGPRSPE